MDKFQIKTVRIHNGNVIDEQVSDPIEAPLPEIVKTVQSNARYSYWEIVDTDLGVIHVTSHGLISVSTVQPVPKPEN
jgi:hypothetical protein